MLLIRQRRAMSSAFSNAAIRKLTSVFYDSAYTVIERWIFPDLRLMIYLLSAVKNVLGIILSIEPK